MDHELMGDVAGPDSDGPDLVSDPYYAFYQASLGNDDQAWSTIGDMYIVVSAEWNRM